MSNKKLVVVATSPEEYAQMDKVGALDGLAELFGADYHLLCSSLECFKNQAAYAHAVIYTDSFEAGYAEVYRYAAASWTVDSIVRITRQDGGIIVKGKYRTQVIDGIDELKDALEYVSDKDEFTGEKLRPALIAVAALMLIFFFMFGSIKTNAKDIHTTTEPAVIEATK